VISSLETEWESSSVLENLAQQKVAEAGFLEVLVEQWDYTVGLGVTVPQRRCAEEIVDRRIHFGIVTCQKEGVELLALFGESRFVCLPW